MAIYHNDVKQEILNIIALINFIHKTTTTIMIIHVHLHN